MLKFDEQKQIDNMVSKIINVKKEKNVKRKVKDYI